MTSSMLRRQLKNLVQNYSEAEVKVREATSNDPWGPSSTQMADISDLTYNVVACNEIMTMLWKRLKDDRNWRHIHKSLTLLEYLLKTGDDRVLLKMKDNIYIVKALTEYRFTEKDGKDQGVNVREKAKVVLVLMEDDDKLKEERDFAVKTREKTSKGAAASSTDAVKDPNYKPCYVPGATGLPSLDNIPSVADLTASFNARKEERLKQEAQKKEDERRAKLSDDELKWEDASKGALQGDAWGEEKAEQEEKTDAWGGSAEPSKSTTADDDAWGAAPKKDSFDNNKEDPFAPAKNGDDSFSSPTNSEDPFAVKNNSDPFNVPKEDPFKGASNGADAFDGPKETEDPFNAPKDDPFKTPKDDAFNTPKDDPFNAPKDDPFNTPKDDPFNTPKDDPFSTPKDDPFNTPKDDPFNTPKDDPFNAPIDDPFTSSKDDSFNAPKDDPFTASKDDPFTVSKDDPFAAQKDDPFTAQKDDPFTASKDDPFTAQKDDPFTATKDDPFITPKDDSSSSPKDPFSNDKDEPITSPINDPFGTSKDDPFCAPKEALVSPTSPKDAFSAASQDDPFAAPTSPPKRNSPKEDPFTEPGTQADPFNTPTSPLMESAAFVPSSPPAASDPWGDVSSPPGETKGADPWGDGVDGSSVVDSSDPFGDGSKADDPWGAPAAAPTSTDDAWGSPAPPTDSSPSDPFGDAKNSDPWGSPSTNSTVSHHFPGVAKTSIMARPSPPPPRSPTSILAAAHTSPLAPFGASITPGQTPLLHPPFRATRGREPAINLPGDAEVAHLFSPAWNRPEMGLQTTPGFLRFPESNESNTGKRWVHSSVSAPVHQSGPQPLLKGPNKSKGTNPFLL
ncbi:uncharacterized protein ACB058_000868 isoform 1-T1 [Synchiropus picturatus]